MAFAKRNFLPLIGLLLLVPVSGCQHLHHHRSKPVPQRTTVFVGGHVRQPTTIDVAAGPVTLAESIERAGGAQVTHPVAPEIAQTTGAVFAIGALITQLDKLEAVLKEYAGTEAQADTLTDLEIPLDDLRANLEIELDALKKADLEVVSGQIRQLLFDDGGQDSEYTTLKIAVQDLPGADTDADRDRFRQQAVEQIKVLREKLNTFRTRLNQYGNIRSSLMLEGSDAFMSVCLKRRGRRYYYDYAIAIRGEARGLPLEPGDLVSVVRYEETPLANSPLQNGGQILLTGWSDGAADTLPDGVRRLGRITKSVDSRLDVPESRLRIEITRRSLGDSEESVFVLPYSQRQDRPLNDFQLHPGDTVAVIPDLQVPLVMDHMFGTIVASGLAEQLALTSGKRPLVSLPDRFSLWMRDQRAEKHDALRQLANPLD